MEETHAIFFTRKYLEIQVSFSLTISYTQLLQTIGCMQGFLFCHSYYQGTFFRNFKPGSYWGFVCLLACYCFCFQVTTNFVWVLFLTVYLRITPRDSGDHMECQRLNLFWQATYPLLYHSDPSFFSFFFFNLKGKQ